MPKLLTIVIPTYNMESYLHTCLSSLILLDESQMRLFEALVIIDGATDRSEDIAREYETKYPDTFRVIVKENGHYGSCINRGLQEAKGKYIKILDADDHFDTQAFAEFLQLLSATDTDAIINYAKIFYPDGKEGGRHGVHERFFQQFPEQHTTFTLEELVSVSSGDTNRSHSPYGGAGEGCVFRPAMHNVAYRTSILRDINYRQTEGVMYSDDQWVFLPMSYAKTVALFPKPLYRYLLGRDNQSVAAHNFRAHFSDLITVRQQIIHDYIHYTGTPVGKQYLRNANTEHLKFVYQYGIFEGLFHESDVRHLDNLLLECQYPHWQELSQLKLRNHSYRHTITLGYWRRSNGRWFYLTESLIRTIWWPYKKIKAIFKHINK